MNPYRSNAHEAELCGRPPFQRHRCWWPANFACMVISLLHIVVLQFAMSRIFREFLEAQQRDLDACNYEEPRWMEGR